MRRCFEALASQEAIAWNGKPASKQRPAVYCIARAMLTLCSMPRYRLASQEEALAGRHRLLYLASLSRTRQLAAPHIVAPVAFRTDQPACWHITQSL